MPLKKIKSMSTALKDFMHKKIKELSDYKIDKN